MRVSGADFLRSELVEHSRSFVDILLALSAFLSRFLPSTFLVNNGGVSGWNAEQYEGSIEQVDTSQECKSREISPSRKSIGDNERFKTQLSCMTRLFDLPKEEQVKHMQFSPDGCWLAVCYEYECRVYDVQVRVVAICRAYRTSD